MFDDGVDHFGEIVVEKFDDLLRGHLFGHGGEVSDVGEENGDAFLLAGEIVIALGVQDAFGDLRGDVSAEDFFDAFAFLEAFDHFVEGGGELADFVVAGEWWCELVDRLS